MPQYHPVAKSPESKVADVGLRKDQRVLISQSINSFYLDVKYELGWQLSLWHDDPTVGAANGDDRSRYCELVTGVVSPMVWARSGSESSSADKTVARDRVCAPAVQTVAPARRVEVRHPSDHR